MPGVAICDAKKKEFGRLWEPTEPHVPFHIAYGLVQCFPRMAQDLRSFNGIPTPKTPLLQRKAVYDEPTKRGAGDPNSLDLMGTVHMEQGYVCSSQVYQPYQYS